jgi:clan AA aspartic protease (TIGR02281 family)
MVRRFLVAAGVLCTLAAASPAMADCQLNLVAEFHLDPKARVPIADGEINGQPVKVLIDTGANVTLMVAEQAKRLGLPIRKRLDVELHGIGGESNGLEATVKSLKIGQLSALNMKLLAVSAPDVAPDVALMLGDDVLSQYDVEFDMADGYIRLMKPQGCSPDQLVYWNKPYSQAELAAANRDSPAVMTTAVLNGKRQAARIDTGAEISVVDQFAASIAGVRRGAGEVHIEGNGQRDGWVGQFDSFALGDEQIGHPKLTVIKLTQDMVDDGGAAIVPRSIDGNTPPTLLIGADFIRAHHLLIGTREHVLVFSFSGGPVFATPSSK